MRSMYFLNRSTYFVSFYVFFESFYVFCIVLCIFCIVLCIFVSFYVFFESFYVFCIVLCIFWIVLCILYRSMYFCIVLCIVLYRSMYCLLYHSMYCLCVNVYCTSATGWQPNCSKQMYHFICRLRNSETWLRILGQIFYLVIRFSQSIIMSSMRLDSSVVKNQYNKLVWGYSTRENESHSLHIGKKYYPDSP